VQHRFEGAVNQCTGDGMMAPFGARFAHDHAQRAGNGPPSTQEASDIARA
jgi:class 3 adenylate cyclase